MQGITETSLVDMNADGLPDILAADQVGIYLNIGGGRFRASDTPTNLSDPVARGGPPIAIDLDGDSLPEVVQPMQHPHRSLVYRNLGSGRLAPRISIDWFSSDRLASIGTVAVFDIDGDSDNDVLSLSGSYGQFYRTANLAYRQSAGELVPSGLGLPMLQMWAERITTSDLDQDGDTDVVIAGIGVEPLAIWHNDGFGNFTAQPVPFPSIPSRRVQAVVNDLNLDSRPDLIVSCLDAFDGVPASSNPYPVLVALGSSTGLQNHSSIPSSNPALVALFSASPFGWDFVRYEYGNATLHRWNQTGFTMFTFPRRYPHNYHQPRFDPLFADIDGDGDIDCLKLFEGRRRVFLTGGLNAYTEIGNAIAETSATALFADMFGDDSPEVVGVTDFYDQSPNTLSILDNNGLGELSDGNAGVWPFQPRVGFYGSGLVVMDVDADGDPDFHLANAAFGSVANAFDVILINNGSTFMTALPIPISRLGVGFRSADLNADGYPDLVGGDSPYYPPLSPMFVRLNRGPALYFNAFLDTDFPIAHLTHDFALADLDQDGDIDVVQANHSSGASPMDSVAVFWNDGTANFTAGPLLMTEAYSIETADFDGDSDNDLLCDERVYWNNGLTGFNYGVSLQSLPSNPGRRFRVFDVDADGDPDVMDTDHFIYENLGGGVFLAPVRGVPVGVAGFITDVGDLDRDGDMDLLDYGGRVLFNHTLHCAVPRLAGSGSTASVELSGLPQASCLLGVSLGAPGAVSTPNGILGLDPSSFVIIDAAALNASGSRSWTFNVTPNTNAIGTTMVFQGAVDTPAGPRLTNTMRSTISQF